MRKQMKNKLLMGLLCSSLLVGMLPAHAATPSAPSLGSGYTYDVVLAYSKSTSLTIIKNDSWKKAITVTGNAGTNYQQICTVTVGFNDGPFNDTDYMYAGKAVGSVYKADPATGIYVNGKVYNGNGSSSSWSGYVTNNAACKKVYVNHNGTAKYYVAFAG